MNKKLISLVLFLILISTSIVPLYAAEEDKGENLALGKTCWATDQYSDTYKPANVNDGNLNTAWASGGTMLNGLSGKWCYITVDLGQKYNITSFVARSRRDINQGYNRAGWYAHFSNDPNFQSFEEVGRKVDAGDYGSDLELSFEQEPKAYRYVRVAHEARGNMVISEIEVYGEPYLGEAKIEFSDVDGKLADSVNLMRSLGIMDSMEKTKFMPNKLMARSDALDTVLKAIGYNFGNSTFDERVLYAEHCGIISSAQEFRPLDYVTVQEYKKMMLSAMGYNEKIKAFGGWPWGIYETQASLGWTRATQQEETELASRGSIANITFYALNSPIFNISTYVDGYVEKNKGELLLTKAFSLSLNKGIVTANNVTNFYEYSKKNEGYIQIDYKEYIDENNTLSEHLGMKVYYLLASDDEKNIVDGFVSKAENDFLEIGMARVTSYNKNEVTYIDDTDDVEDISLDEDCIFIKNGVAKITITENDFKKENGKILFVDNDGDSYFEIVFLNIPIVVVCDYCVDNGETLDFRGLDGTDLKSTYDSVSYYRNGRKVLAEQMSRNSLIYCYVSDNEKVVRFECFTNKVKGTIDFLSTKYIGIDGVQYEVSEYFAVNEASEVSVGSVGIFVFDEKMRIVAIVENEDLFSGELFGVVLARNQQGLAKGQIKLFTQNDEIVVLNESEKLTIDGKPINDVNFDSFIGEIIIFKTNIYDEIAAIYTKHAPNPRIVEDKSEIENAWYYGDAVFDSGKENANMLFLVDNNSLVFTLPYIGDELATGKEYEGNYSADIFANVIKKGNNGKMTYFNVDDFMTPQIIIKKTAARNSEVGLISKSDPGIYMYAGQGRAYENGEYYTELELVDVLTGEKVKRLYHEDYDKILMYDKMLVKGYLISSTLRIPATNMTEAGKAAIDENLIPITSLRKGDIIRGQLQSGSNNIFEAVDRIYTAADFSKTVSYISYGENAPNANSYFILRCGTLANIKDGKLQLSVSGDGKYFASNYGNAKKLIVFDGDINVRNARELPAYVDSGSEIVILSGQGKDNAIFVYND